MDKTIADDTHTQSPDEAAYLQGYNDCKKSNKKNLSAGLLESYYAPTAGYEAKYQAGWDKAQEEEDKKTVRRAGVGPLIIGACSLVIGIIGLFGALGMFTDLFTNGTSGSPVSGMAGYALWGSGALALFGLGLVIKGLVSTLSGRDLDRN